MADEKDKSKTSRTRWLPWLSQRLRVIFMDHIFPFLRSRSFITLHYLYFLTTCMISAFIFWGSSTPARSVRFIDSVFLAVSAMTEAGLNTVNLSTLNTWQQVILFILIIMGSAIFVSSATLHIRKSAFERRLEELAERKQKHFGPLRTLTFTLSKRRPSRSDPHEAAVAAGVLRGRAIHDPETTDIDGPMTIPYTGRCTDTDSTRSAKKEGGDNSGQPGGGQHIAFDEEAQRPRRSSTQMRPPRRRSSIFNNSGVTARGLEAHPRYSQPVFESEDDDEEDVIPSDARPVKTERSGSLAKVRKYLDSFSGRTGRNSQFHHLTEKERRKLGGIEYDALCVLSYLVPAYFVIFQACGAIGVGAWLRVNRPSTTLTNGIGPFWTGAFFAVSAFNNSGMALLDANAVALQTSYYCLLTLSLMILAGNTCFPPFLRLCVWTLKKITSRGSSPRFQKWTTVLNFILDHPRRVYTNLFPAKQTWWLVFSLVLLNGIDWVAFEILNLGNPVVTSIPAHFRVLDGLFQAFAVRSGGFYVVPIAGLYPGLLILYVLMMYVSAFPVTMTIRNTNVYEERSLGIFADEQPNPNEDDQQQPEKRKTPFLSGLRRTLTMTHGGGPDPPTNRSSWTERDFIRQQLRGQLGHDLWWIALAVMFIAIVETSQFKRDPINFSIFNIIFEVVSAYGCVGISVGVPWDAYSFCGAWHTTSKLILCAVMLRGRHRGLPVAIDRAILLPDRTLAWAEEEDAVRRRGRNATPSSTAVDGSGNDMSRRVTDNVEEV